MDARGTSRKHPFRLAYGAADASLLTDEDMTENRNFQLPDSKAWLLLSRALAVPSS